MRVVFRAPVLPVRSRVLLEQRKSHLPEEEETQTHTTTATHPAFMLYAMNARDKPLRYRTVTRVLRLY